MGNPEVTLVHARNFQKRQSWHHFCLFVSYEIALSSNRSCSCPHLPGSLLDSGWWLGSVQRFNMYGDRSLEHFMSTASEYGDTLKNLSQLIDWTVLYEFVVTACHFTDSQVCNTFLTFSSYEYYLVICLNLYIISWLMNWSFLFFPLWIFTPDCQNTISSTSCSYI